MSDEAQFLLYMLEGPPETDRFLYLPPNGDPLDSVFGWRPRELPEVPGLVELPASGPGYKAVSEYRYGTPLLIDLIRESSRLNAETVPDGINPTLLIGDMSKEGGGKLGQHRGHRGGTDVDIYVPVKKGSGQQEWPNDRLPSNYSPEAAQRLVNIILHVGGPHVRIILTSDRNVTGKGVRHDNDHYNHIHVGLYP